jgi:DNA-binding NtrC family response regulator
VSASPSYVLKVLADDGSLVRRFLLAPGEHTVGSASDADVHLEAAGLSRRHARLRVLADGGVVIADLGSKNGTLVAGRRVREIAVSGITVVAFGSVKALLQPADAASEQVLLEPPAGEGRPPRGEGRTAAGHGLTTDGLQPVERLAESLEELLLPMLGGLAGSVEETAQALVHRWIAELPLGRVEILRLPQGASRGEALVAAASTTQNVPKAAVGLDVQGPDGWLLRLRATGSAALGALIPLFRLALSLLALGALGEERPRRNARTQGAPRAPETSAPPPPPPAGLSPETARLYRQTGKVARGDVPVLILGESGSGKEVLARWVHARSRRAGGPFLAVNCAALPRELLEAELFGIEKGVATGVEARPGLLERGSGGTVFLDEVGDMAAETQAKVLRVLESTSLYRVGGRAPVTIDVRFVAATNRDLETLVEEGGFRRDLYHRLAAFEVKLPPLRERRAEIPSLAAQFFHREIEKSGVASPGITRAALGALVRYPWPGNIREMQNEIAKAALLLERGEALDLQHLSARVRRPPEGETGSPAAALTLEETVLRAEREAFAVALAAAEGDAARAMELLGVSRTTWYRKLKELGLGESEPGV